MLLTTLNQPLPKWPIRRFRARLPLPTAAPAKSPKPSGVGRDKSEIRAAASRQEFLRSCKFPRIFEKNQEISKAWCIPKTNRDVYTSKKNFENPWCIPKSKCGPVVYTSKMRNTRTVLVYTKTEISKTAEFRKIPRFCSQNFLEVGAARPRSLYTISNVLPPGDAPRGRF